MITKIELRGNGDVILRHDTEELQQVKLLDPLIADLLVKKLIDGDTPIHIPMSAESIKVSQWFDVEE